MLTYLLVTLIVTGVIVNVIVFIKAGLRTQLTFIDWVILTVIGICIQGVLAGFYLTLWKVINL